MAFGTAGLTAGLCLRKLLQHGLKPDDGKVFVSWSNWWCRYY